MYVCMYVCMYVVRMCVYIYIHTYAHFFERASTPPDSEINWVTPWMSSARILSSYQTTGIGT